MECFLIYMIYLRKRKKKKKDIKYKRSYLRSARKEALLKWPFWITQWLEFHIRSGTENIATKYICLVKDMYFPIYLCIMVNSPQQREPSQSLCTT